MISKDNLLYILKYLILIISVFVLNFFLVFKASALETMYPTQQVNKNGTMWYGYSLPTRATNTDSLGSSVYLNISNFTTDNSRPWTSSYANHLKVGLRDLPQQVITALSNSNTGGLDYQTYYNIPKLWSETYNLDLLYQYKYFGFGFQPGISVSTDKEVIEDGYSINYDSIYSYDFDLVINTDDEEHNLPINYVNSLQLCSINSITGDYFCNTYNSNYYSYDLIYSSDKIQYYRFHIKFNSYTFGYGFNYVVVENNSNRFNMDGKNLFGNFNQLPSGTYVENVKFTFSQPYNIVLWNNETSMTCTNTCWTQQQTDDNQRILNDSNYLWNTLTGTIGDFDYYGFSGIVTLSYNYLIDILSDDTCNVLNVPVLSTSFNMPSACSFWNRNDISTFKSLYEMVWLGLISYYVCWRVFKDILRLYDPSTSVIEGNEVADL